MKPIRGLGGLSLGLKKLEGIKIDDITIIIQPNSAKTHTVLRIIAPQDKKIERVKVIDNQVTLQPRSKYKDER